MKFIDLFSGIGGFRLGMEMAGHECAGHCELDKFADSEEEVIEPIKEQPKAGEWIPCSEGLPGDGKYILLSFENFTMPTVGRYEADDEGGAFHVGDDDETCVQHDLFVNAWMPLPEPYKEGNENGRS